jgi:hypothetical protein
MNAMHQSNAVTTLFRLASMVCLLASAYAQAYEYPFQNPALPAVQRIDNILSLMTVEEKIAALSTDSSVKRLGIPSFGSSEGIHGVVKRGNAEKGLAAIPTTQFPQPPGMGETWNPSLVRAAGEIQGTEGRYITQNPKYNQPSMMLWGPQSDLARDPRWGRTEEVCIAKIPSWPARCPPRSSRACRAMIPNTGARPPCLSISWPTATRMAAAIPRPTLMNGCSGNTTRCRFAWASRMAARVR